PHLRSGAEFLSDAALVGLLLSSPHAATAFSAAAEPTATAPHRLRPARPTNKRRSQAPLPSALPAGADDLRWRVLIARFAATRRDRSGLNRHSRRARALLFDEPCRSAFSARYAGAPEQHHRAAGRSQRQQPR